MTDLVVRVKRIEKLENRFEALRQFQGTGKQNRLLRYSSHRFLGLTRVVLQLPPQLNHRPFALFLARSARI